MLQIEESNPNSPVRVLIYGGTGIGKSTFGARAQAPIFITPEGGTDQLTDSQGNPVKSLKGMSSWDAIRTGITDLTNDKHNFKTLVLDSADWIEKLCHAKIIGNSGTDIIRVNKGYGAGYRESERMHRELIEQLSTLRTKRNMNIVITAHAGVRLVQDPEAVTAYDQFEIKCHSMVSSLWREWVDALLFARIKTFIKVGEDDKGKAMTDGTRVVYAVEKPAFQAKNRFGMPGELVFTENFWDDFLNYARKGVSVEQLKQEIHSMIILVTDAELNKRIEDSVKDARNNVSKLLSIRNRLKEITKGAR